MALQKEMSENLIAALIFLAVLREASKSKAIYNLVGALSNESLGSWVLFLLRNGCNYLPKFLT